MIILNHITASNNVIDRIFFVHTEMHKYTDKKSTDYRNLELAQSDLKDVTTHINEDKRITDERMVLFEIMNDIENCPVSVHIMIYLIVLDLN